MQCRVRTSTSLILVTLATLHCLATTATAQRIGGIPFIVGNFSSNVYRGSAFEPTGWDISYGPGGLFMPTHEPAQVIATFDVVTPTRTPSGAAITSGVPLELYGFVGNGLFELADRDRRDQLLLSVPAVPPGGIAYTRADVTEFFRTTIQSRPGGRIQGALGFVAIPAGDATNKFVGGWINFWERDGTIENPFLPASESPFTFIELPRGWVDPPTAPGFSYAMTSGSLFTEISDFPTGFSQKFSVSVDDQYLGSFGPGERVDFRTFPGGGVSRFTVAGIRPLVDPDDPLAFPLKLDYNTPRASFTMVPIPEPSTLAMTGMAGLLLAAGRWRKRHHRRAMRGT